MKQKKNKKQVKLVKDMSDRELRVKRKIWKTNKAKKAYNKKKKQIDMDRYMTQNSPPDSDALTTPQIVLSRQG